MKPQQSPDSFIWPHIGTTSQGESRTSPPNFFDRTHFGLSAFPIGRRVEKSPAMMSASFFSTTFLSCSCFAMSRLFAVVLLKCTCYPPPSAASRTLTTAKNYRPKSLASTCLGSLPGSSHLPVQTCLCSSDRKASRTKSQMFNLARLRAVVVGIRRR